MNKTKWILVFLLPVQWLSIHLIKNQSLWIEQIYSLKVYPVFFKLQRFFFSALPFSIGDLAYGLAIVYIIWSTVRLFKRKLKVRTLILNTLAAASLLSLFFHLLWGLNYYRIPLNKKLNYNLEYNEDQLEQTLKSMIESTNKLHQSLTHTDSVAVQIPYSKIEIIEQLQANFSFKLADFKTQPYLKNSLWSTVLSYMGFAGYLNPLTLESQVNSKIPKLNYITTAAHEMAHQLGIASESEANFVAYYSCAFHSDPFIQFSGYSFALRYCYSELYKANPEKAKNQLLNLRPGVFKNFQQLSDFWKKFQNPFEPYFKKGYDSYLKVNGQAKGILSYNGMVGMVVAHTLERELAPE